MPSLGRIALAVVGCALVLPTEARPQARPPVAVRGVAYDGIRKRPLRDAVITLSGEHRQTITDSKGRFQFDSVAPGVYTFAAHHATLDSLGFPGLSMRTTITDGAAEIRISVPSFESLWRVACGSRRAPEDSGFVYGTVRDAVHMRPVANALVRLSWTQMFMRSRNLAVQRKWNYETRTDSTGSYSACGVPKDEWLIVNASSDSVASGMVSVAPTSLRVQRRDLLMGPTTPGAAGSRGMIVGMVTDATSEPFPEARVVLDSTTEVRSDADGRFVLRNVPTGTRQLEVTSIGVLPSMAVVDVGPLDTSVVTVQLSKAVTIDGMKVVAARAGQILHMEYELRKRAGTGYFRDSTAIKQFRTLPMAIGSIPSTSIREMGTSLEILMPSERGGRCKPDVWIDGTAAEFGHLIDLQPNEVAAFEVYPRILMVPSRYTMPGHLPDCGAILVWTKYGFRNR